jgi:uncharacterized delta-60 repeat protein
MHSLSSVVLTLIALVLLPQSALAAAGDRDTSFNGDGMATMDVAGAGGFAQGSAVVIQDGKILVAGDWSTSGGERDWFVARFETDGDPDPLFGGGDGFATFDFGGSDSLDNALAVLSNGKIVIAGYHRETSGNVYSLVLARLNNNGTLDTSFAGGQGYVMKSYGFANGVAPYDLLVQPDGKIVVAGGAYVNNQDCDVAVWRFKAGGKKDTTFSGDGMALNNVAPGCDEAWRISRESNGAILVGGWSEVDEGSGDDNIMLTRFTAGGAIDRSFGLDGVVEHNPTTYDNEYVNGMARSGNKILLVLNADDDIVLLRLNANGALDRTWGGGDGEIVADLGATEEPDDIVVQPDGKIVVAGTQGSNIIVARLNVNGTPDSGFGTGGLATAALPGGGKSLVLQANGRIVAVGSDSNNHVAVARFLP